MAAGSSEEINSEITTKSIDTQYLDQVLHLHISDYRFAQLISSISLDTFQLWSVRVKRSAAALVGCKSCRKYCLIKHNHFSEITNLVPCILNGESESSPTRSLFFPIVFLAPLNVLRKLQGRRMEAAVFPARDRDATLTDVILQLQQTQVAIYFVLGVLSVSYLSICLWRRLQFTLGCSMGLDAFPGRRV